MRAPLAHFNRCGLLVALFALSCQHDGGDQGSGITSRADVTGLSIADAAGSLSMMPGGAIVWVEPDKGAGAYALAQQGRTVRVDFRASDGSKSALVDKPLSPNETVSYRAKAPGYLSVHRCSRPASLDARPDAWQIASLCEITHVRVGTPEDWRSDAHLTSKIGLPIELRAYRSTAQLRPGEVVPVRLYQRGVPMSQRTLRAKGPKGMRAYQSNDRGVAEIEIDAAGKWVIEAELPDQALPQGRATVRLNFEVSDASNKGAGY